MSWCRDFPVLAPLYFMSAFIPILLLVCMAVTARAQDYPGLTVGMTGSVEELTWSIAGNLNGTHPNVFSELEWEGLAGAGGYMLLEVPFKGRLGLSASGSRQQIVAGTATDTDYQEDDRTNSMFRAQENANKGYVAQGRLSVTYRLIQANKLRMTMSAGYGLLNQKLFLHNPSTSLNSSYMTHWFGPTAGGKLAWIHDRFRLTFSSIYHQVDYAAKANWNLIEEFKHPVSFRHRAKGYGLSVSLGIAVKGGNQCWWFVAPTYDYWTTGKGIDTLYKQDGTTPKTRLNDVTRRAGSISVGVRISFLPKSEPPGT